MRTRFIQCRQCKKSGETKFVQKGRQCPECGAVAINQNRKHQINTMAKVRDWSKVNENCPVKETGVFTMLGPEWERPVTTDAEVQRIYDEYNRHYEGERYAQPLYL